MTITTGEREERVAVRRIEGFAKEYGEAHRNLARHAAFPLVLTPDLLYQIWATFVPEAPWTAVAHVLLSRLCRQVGYETYEMDIADRNLLLRELKEQFGQERLDELGEFLLDYVAQRLTEDDPDTQDLREAQEWTALAYTKPNELARELAEALSSRIRQQEMAEVLRLASLVETFAEPLVKAGFQPLLFYARGIGSFARADWIGAVAQLSKILERENQIRVAEISLPIPEQIFEEVEDVRKQAQTYSSYRKLNTPKLDLGKFYQASNPSKRLDLGKAEDRKYYIDFSTVQGNKIIQELKRTITRLSPDKPTCQLFTGHIGCGKSTELLMLKKQLEQQGLHVVYFESSQDLDMADTDVTDIMLAIARQVSESLEQLNISLQPTGFRSLLQRVAKILQTEIELEAETSLPGFGEISADTQGNFSLSFGIAKISAKTKNSPELRSQMRQYLEPRTDTLIQMINSELLEPAINQLKQQGKQGLVVIVDNLDRVDESIKPTGRTQSEYLFVDRGEKLKQLNCHVVYTIPLVLVFSNNCSRLTTRFRVEPKLLPMVRVKSRDGSDCEEGLYLLRQMVLARAFPDLRREERLALIPEVFDSPETLDRLCRVSGGHARSLLGLLYGCFQKEDPPFSRSSLEDVVRSQRDALVRAVTDDEWELLSHVSQQQMVKGEDEYKTLLRSMFVFEYQDEQGGWFSINPILAEAKGLA